LIVLGPEEPFHAVERRICQQRGQDALNAKGNFDLQSLRIGMVVTVGHCRSVAWRRGWSVGW
jgi:hypothetical protein